VSFQNISDCNCQLCISDVIVVTETTILVNFYAGTLAVEFPAVPPKADIDLRELNVRQGPIADWGAYSISLWRAATNLVHRLGCIEINRQLAVLGAAQWAWRHAI
jgi:hypothetical protein